MSFPELELVVKYKVDSAHVRTTGGEVIKIHDLEQVEARAIAHSPPPAREPVESRPPVDDSRPDPVEERQLAVIIRHHHDKGLSDTDIGREMGIPRQRVTAIRLKKWVVAEEKPKAGTNKSKLIRLPRVEHDDRGVVMTPALAAAAKRLVKERGMSAFAVSRKIGCSYDTVRRAIQ
jgi:hypothetical protein